MTNSIGEIRDADFLFVIGSNTSEAHPIIAMEMKRAVKRGATLVVADPRAIWMSTIAEKHLHINPGTDVWLLNAMAHVIIEENLIDEEFIKNSTENFEDVKEAVKNYTPEEAEKMTGISAEDIRWTARKYATTKKAGIYYTLGITEHTHGIDYVYALSNLVLMTGHLGKPSAGMNPLRGQNNVQGANDAGATPVFYPGYQKVDDKEVQKKYEKSWGTSLSPNLGLNLNEMMKTAGNKIKAFFVMGEDIVLSEPNVLKLEEGLNQMEFIVIQEPFINETTRFADVVFPSGVFAEKDGTFTNSERRVQRVRKAVEPPGNALADWEILVRLANACGANWDYKNPAEIYSEFVKDTPKFSGISHERLDTEIGTGGKTGLQWPCENPSETGTKYLHENGISRGKGLFQAVSFEPSPELPCEEYGLLLSTGRTLYHYNAATQTRREEGLALKQSEAFIEIHPKDAKKRGIAHKEMVEVRTRRGSIEARALYSRQVRPHCIWMPLHFAEARANVLTNDVGDKITGTASYKICAAEVFKLDTKDHSHDIFPGAFFFEESPELEKELS